MERDPRIEHMPAAMANVVSELVDAGVKPEAVARELVDGAGRFMAKHKLGERGPALLRQKAAELEPTSRDSMEAPMAEALERLSNAQSFLRTMQLAGAPERAAVTATLKACVLAVARTKGAALAADWLEAMARETRDHAAMIDLAAKAS